MATQLAALKADIAPTAERKPKTIFDFLMDDKVKNAIGAVAGQYTTPDRFLRLAINAVKKTPRLLECDPQTVLGAFMASAALALEPNTVLQQAFLIPYGKRGKLPDNTWGIVSYECQFQIGYRGFITLAHRSPHVLNLEAEAIHSSDHFDHLKGSRSFLEYRKALKDRGELIGAFAFSKIEGGTEAATVLDLNEIHKIRGRSETYQALLRGVDKQGMKDWEKKKAEEKLADTPWVMWEDDMAAKSAIKKHAKQLPLQPGDAMTAAVALDADRDDGMTIDLADLADVDKMKQVMADGEIQQDDAPLAAITHQEGNYIEMPTGSQQQGQKVDVRAFNEAQAAQARTVDQRAAEGTQAPTGRGPGSDDTPFDNRADELAAAMEVANTPDALDLIADQIRTAPSTEQPRLNKLFRQRHAQLESGNRPAARDPRQSTISME